MTDLGVLIQDAIIQNIIDKESKVMKGCPSGKMFRHDIPNKLKSIIDPSEEKYKFMGTIGQGAFAQVPIVCIFDKRITKNATRGIYVVQLTVSDGSGVYFVLGQGSSMFIGLFGEGKYGREQLRKVTEGFRSLLKIPERYNLEKQGGVVLKGTRPLALGYEVGSIAGIYYDINSIPNEKELLKDISQLLSIYDDAVDLIGDNSYEEAAMTLLKI